MKPLPRNLALVGALATLFLAGCRRGGPTAQPPALPAVPAHVQRAEMKERAATEEVVGTVRAKLHAAIEAKISARIEKMLVVPGQKVATGQLLAELDAQEVQARVDQAKAVFQQADSDWKRFGALWEQKVLSQAEYDAAKSRFGVAQASLIEAQTMLDYTKVVAPFDGTITRKLADVGDLAAPGRPLLEMEDGRTLRLEADVPEAMINNIQVGDELAVHASALEPELKGTVDEIAPAADPNSRTFLVKLDLPVTPGLRAGQFGRVSIPIGKTSALRVPAAAVIQRGQMEIIFIAQNGRAQLRLVKTGKRVGNEVEIVSGLDAGELVVTDGAGQLLDGQPLLVQ